MNYMSVEFTPMPGVSVRANAAYGDVGGEWYPVAEALPLNGGGYLPVLNVPQMSDVQWQRRCLEDRLANPEKYAQIENVGEATARLRKWILEHAGE